MNAKSLLKHDTTCHDSTVVTEYTALTRLSLPRTLLTRTDTFVTYPRPTLQQNENLPG